MAVEPQQEFTGEVASDVGSREVLRLNRSNEIFFGVVGPVGAGGSRVMASLQRACEKAGYDCVPISASKLIREWAEQKGKKVPDEDSKTLDTVVEFQNLGDDMREKDAAAVAVAAIRKIVRNRAAANDQEYVEGEPVPPGSEKRAYLVESIRHPAEVHLLRRTYANSFALIGVVCEESERKKRILGKYFTIPKQQDLEVITRVDNFMTRDSDDPERPHGQHVTNAFFEADFFLDNSRSDPTDEKQFLDEPLGRLIDIISKDCISPPTISETAMHHAHSAQVRSVCISRQVGAALVDSDGTIVATGVNEVPRAGGGVYGENFASGVMDHRCAFRDVDKPYCSSNREQNNIVDELIGEIPELKEVEDKKALTKKIRKTRLGRLLEFSRAVHAEMDALLSAGREGISTVGTRLFVTTFPCHYCARHIVSAGVYEVQYIEPYPKSLALQLHDDAIETNPSCWRPPEAVSMAQENQKKATESGPEPAKKVLFHPFVGVAPRFYIRAFRKTWNLKDKISGDLVMKAPEWGDEGALMTIGYPELEARLAKQS